MTAARSAKAGWTFGILLAILVLTLAAHMALAHDEDLSLENHGTSEPVWVNPEIYIEISAAWLAVWGIFLAMRGKKFVEAHKKTYFLLVIIPIIISSFYLAGYTVYENIISQTKGPIHWHADYQVWVCGQRLDLVDPKFPSNKIGTPLFHEHNDDRMHIEGTVMELQDIDLGRYFSVIGGELYPGHLKYRTQQSDGLPEGLYDYHDGDYCPDGTQGSLKVYINGRRMDDFNEYVIYPDAYVPPGDCIIVLFDGSESDTTDRICESWSAKGWSYDGYARVARKVGDHTWQ